MTGLLGLWSHLLAAALFGALALWQLRRWSVDPLSRPLVTAFAVVAVWAIFLALLGPQHMLSRLAECARNLAFLTFLYGMMRDAGEDRRHQAVKLVYAAVAGVIGLQIVIAGVVPQFLHLPKVLEALDSTSHVLGLTIAAGALVLVHNLYGQAAAGSRDALRLPMLALTGMWAYDLHLYTVAYLTREPVADLFAMRGAILAMVVPLFALAIRRNAGWKMQLSRAATFQSLSVLVILAYLILMMSATRALELVGGEWVRSGQIGLLFAMTVAAFVLLPSGRARAWISVILAKHLFEHRYDYREEWLRFTRTIARETEGGEPIDERVLKAIADISGAPAGLLLLADERRRLTIGARWNWTAALPRFDGRESDYLRFVEQRLHVIDFAPAPERLPAPEQLPLPPALAAIEQAWAGVPLVHSGRLIGLVVLQHPQLRRRLDWEDFDLFRTAGMQAASYLAEARSQQALADARRFDEFNRRFAFILHDIKNLVSQLSLVARNAERHADNPEFREDMVATLQSSVKKMNDLLARLSPDSMRRQEDRRTVPIQPLLAGIARARRGAHPITLEGDARLCALAEPGRLEQALAHLLQNAIEASPEEEPVRIRFETRGGEAAIEIIDGGHGMSPEFIRARLFQPFDSTKPDGFGVGAFEARTIVAAMGGRLEVESHEGEGSRFTIFLPLAERTAPPQSIRVSA